jgi:hypothetical protein
MTTIDRALADPNLLGAALGPTTSWQTWLTILRACFGQALSDDELVTFATVAGSRKPPEQRVRELWAVAGRRSGKSRIAAAVLVFIALFVEHTKLAPGEVGHVLCISASKDQAKLIFEYALAFITASPVLRRELLDATSEEIELCGSVVIGVHSSSYKTVRGRTLLAVVMDEVAYWPCDDAALPDRETYRAVVPALLAADGLLIAISSGYRRAGLLHTKYRAHFGRDDDDVLCIQAPTVALNPTIDPAIIEKAKASDSAAAEAEWLGGFRDDIADFVDRATVEACVTDMCRERVPVSGVTYFAHIDPSGGRNDSFALAIAHRDRDVVVLDCVREVRPPFSPSAVCAEFAAVLRRYGIAKCTSDRYAAEWPVEEMAKNRIRVEWCQLTSSALFLELLPMLNSKTVALLDHDRLVNQIAALERRPGRNTDIVGHPPGGHDDVAVACAGAAFAALSQERRGIVATGYGVHLGEIDWHVGGEPERSEVYRTADGRLMLRSPPSHSECVPTNRKSNTKFIDGLY